MKMSGQVYSPAVLHPWQAPGVTRYCPLNRRLGGPQCQSGCFGDEKHPLPLPGIEPHFVGCPTRSLVTTPKEQCRLPHNQITSTFCRYVFTHVSTTGCVKEFAGEVECCRMKFHVSAHRQITRRRSDAAPVTDACGCLVPGTVDTTTNCVATTNCHNAITVHVWREREEEGGGGEVSGAAVPGGRAQGAAK